MARRSGVTDEGESAPIGRTSAAEAGAVLAILVAAAGATLLATSRYGIGLTADSVEYRAGAVSLADGLGYTRNGDAITVFPPGYSAALSLGERLGLGAVDGARLLSMGAFVATTLLGYALLRRHVRTRGARIASTVVIGCSGVLLAVFDSALSEHLFVVVVLLLVVVAEDLQVPRPRWWLLAAAVALVWAGFSLRYAGIVLLPYLAVVVLVGGWPSGRRGALLRTAAVSVAGLALPLLWLLRNIDAGGQATGSRGASKASVLTNLQRTAYTFSGWVSFEGPSILRLVAGLAALGLATALVVLVLPVRHRVVARTRDLRPLLLLVVMYVAYLVATASVTGFAPIDTRYLIPVYVPIVVLAAWVIERALARVGGSARPALSALAVAWVAANVVWFGIQVVEDRRDGAGGYATRGWQESELIEDVVAWDSDVALVTNDPLGVELFTGRYVPETVARTFGGSNEGTGRLGAFVERVRCQGHLGLAWFTRPGDRSRLYSPEELAQHLRVVPLVRRADGVMYDLQPLPGDDDPVGGGC